MKPRKILMLTNRVPYPLTDGGNLAMDASISAYIDAGFRVYLLSMNTRRHPVSEERWESLYPGLDGKSMVPLDNRIRPIPFIQNWFFSSLPNHVVRFHDENFGRVLEQVLAQFEPDFIQMESVFLTSYLPRIRKASRAKCILRLHNIEYQIWDLLSKKEPNCWRRHYLKNLSQRIRLYEESSWNSYDLLLPITLEDAQVLEHHIPHASPVCWPFGWKSFPKVDFDPTRPLRRAYHLGAMDWLPNQEGIQWFLEKVWPRVHARFPAFHFSFGGRNMPSAFTSYQGNQVNCLGQVPSAQDFIEDKDILVVPLRSAGGIRVKILEAMAAKKLVISSSAGMEGISAQPGVHFLLADRESDFLDAFEWILQHPQEAKDMIERAHGWVVAHFSNSELVKPVLAAIDRLS